MPKRILQGVVTSDPISAHAAHLNLPPSASPPSADHPCGSALLTAWPRGGHSPGLDPGFEHSSFSHAFSSSPSSLLTFRLLLSTAVGFSQDHPCGSLSTWPRGGLKCPGLGLTCVGHSFGHLAFLGWCGSLVLGSLRACGVQSSR